MNDTLQPDHDQRRHKRYHVQDRIFAVVRSKTHQLSRIEKMSRGEIGFALLKSNSPKMGQIIDASLGGLSFRYVANPTTASKTNEMDILFIDQDFHLSRIPFRAIEDGVLKDDSPFDSLPMNRMTVEFRQLTPHQRLKLGQLLDKYTTGEVDAGITPTGAG